MRNFLLRPILAACFAAALLTAQTAAPQPAPPASSAAPAQIPPVQTAPAQTAPAQTAAPEPAPPASSTAPAQTPPVQTAPAQNAPAQTPVVPIGGLDFQLTNGSLTNFIDIVAQRLKINYILDPAVKGSVSLYTYGEPKPTDLMSLLQTVLRVNGATIVKVGDLYRIVPINRISALPLDPVLGVDEKTLPQDERTVLDLIFLKYTTAKEIDALITPFLGEGASHSTYDSANLLILQDNARSMKRTLELIALFDSDTFAGQRVHLFDVVNSRPSDMVKELDTVFKAYALSDKNSAVKFIAVDRINTIIAVAPNPGIFTQVKTWLDKLDIAVKVQAGEMNTYVYRLKYGRAETVAVAITALFTGNISALVNMASMSNSGGMGTGGYGGMNYSGGSNGSMGYGTQGYGYGNTGYGNTGYGGSGYGAQQYGNMYGTSGQVPPVSAATAGSANPTAAATPNTDQTGSYLSLAAAAGGQGGRMPHIIPNPFDNTLLIQATPQEWQQISNLLRQIDVAPRQVLIEAKIYELDLNGAFSEGISAYFEKKDANGSGQGRSLNVTSSSAGLNFSLGELVSHSKEILGVLQTLQHADHSRVVSAPSIIATDSIPAVMNVGEDVPTLTSEGLTSGTTSSGSSLFTNTVSNRSTGVTLSIVARVNSSGVVTMVINQDVSTPQAPSTSSAIQSPSFSRRSFSTQLTVQDGDTVAIGGFISDTTGGSSDGVPLLSRIPLLGGLFGARATSRGRTELIIFLTPKVLYDTNQVVDATEEIKSGLSHLQKAIRDQ